MTWKDEVAGRIMAAVCAQDSYDGLNASRAYDLADALAAESCRRYGHKIEAYPGYVSDGVGCMVKADHCSRCGKPTKDQKNDRGELIGTEENPHPVPERFHRWWP